MGVDTGNLQFGFFVNLRVAGGSVLFKFIHCHLVFILLLLLHLTPMYIPPCPPTPASEPPDPLHTVRNRPFWTLAFLRLYVLRENFVCIFCDRYGCRVSTDSVSGRSGPALFVNLRPFGLALFSIYVVAVMRTLSVPPSSLCGENGVFTLFQDVDFDHFRVWRPPGLWISRFGMPLPSHRPDSLRSLIFVIFGLDGSRAGFPALGHPSRVITQTRSDR